MSLFGSPIKPPTTCTARLSKPQSRTRHRPARPRQPLLVADLSRSGPAPRHRAVAELVGTAFLVAAVVGSGIAAQRLSPNDIGLQLLENSIATGDGLIALILAFGPVSGAHF